MAEPTRLLAAVEDHLESWFLCYEAARLWAQHNEWHEPRGGGYATSANEFLQLAEDAWLDALGDWWFRV